MQAGVKDGGRAIVLAIAGAALAVFCGAGFTQVHSSAFPSLLVAMAAMAALTGGFAIWAHVRRVEFAVTSAVRTVHWGQFCVQLSILLMLGRASKEVMEYIPLVFCQLAFAVLWQILLAGFLRKQFEFSFAVFPVVGSVNLFIWFYPEYFACQLLMIAFALTAKSALRYGGKHVFNPSGFAMALTVYLVLLLSATGPRAMFSSALLLAYEQSANIMLVWVFIASCVSLHIAGRFAVAAGGVLVMTVAFFGAKALFGLPLIVYVVHPNVFVGFTLLITDPATSPKKVSAQFLYGMAYGCTVLAGFALLAKFGYSTFYDKILFLPLLNALVPLFSRVREVPFLESPLGRRAVVALHGALFILAVMPYRIHPDCIACFGKAAGALTR